MNLLSVSDVAEWVGLIRDVVLLVVLLAVLLTTLLVYRKVSGVLGSARRTVQTAEDIISTVTSSMTGPTVAGSKAALRTGKVLAFLVGLPGKLRGGGKGDGNNGK